MLDTSAPCGCGTKTSLSSSDRLTTSKGTDMTIQTYSVTGMTCDHCKQSVASELEAIDGVTDVAVDLVAGGTSTVTVTSATPLEETQVVEALDEAGEYRLV